MWYKNYTLIIDNVNKLVWMAPMLLWYSWCVRWSEEPEDAVRFRGEAPNKK